MYLEFPLSLFVHRCWLLKNYLLNVVSHLRASTISQLPCLYPFDPEAFIYPQSLPPLHTFLTKWRYPYQVNFSLLFILSHFVPEASCSEMHLFLSFFPVLEFPSNIRRVVFILAFLFVNHSWNFLMHP